MTSGVAKTVPPHGARGGSHEGTRRATTACRAKALIAGSACRVDGAWVLRAWRDRRRSRTGLRWCPAHASQFHRGVAVPLLGRHASLRRCLLRASPAVCGQGHASGASAVCGPGWTSGARSAGTPGAVRTARRSPNDRQWPSPDGPCLRASCAGDRHARPAGPEASTAWTAAAPALPAESLTPGLAEVGAPRRSAPGCRACACSAWPSRPPGDRDRTRSRSEHVGVRLTWFEERGIGERVFGRGG
jgi:hypothetical protein